MAMTVAEETAGAARSRLGIVVIGHGPTTTIILTGEWDLASETKTREVIRPALQRHPESVVLDLSALTCIDSTGLTLRLLPAPQV